MATTNGVTNVVASLPPQTNVVLRVTQSDGVREREIDLLGKLARAGTGLLEENETGYLRVCARDPDDTSRRLTLDSRWLLRMGVDESTLRGLPTIRTSVEWDQDEGAREVRKVELGLFNDVLWLMHEQREDESSVMGFQLRGTW